MRNQFIPIYKNNGKLNQRGLLTMDFLFAMVLILGMTLVLMTFSMALSAVEMVQYMAFASSRAYFAGNLTEAKQKDQGKAKFRELLQTPGIGNLLKPQWIQVSMDRGEPTNFYDVYGSSPGETGSFIGVRVNYTPKFLEFSIPFYGSIQAQSGTGFSSFVTSFLGREPSSEECSTFMANRWNLIQSLSSRFQGAADTKYYPIDDNGC